MKSQQTEPRSAPVTRAYEGDTLAGTSRPIARMSGDASPLREPLRKTHMGQGRPPFECVALLLQGGGALGAYQAGVYEALAEARLYPNWVAGISIGAINSALIAGNPPEARVDKLRQFWERVTDPLTAYAKDLG